MLYLFEIMWKFLINRCGYCKKLVLEYERVVILLKDNDLFVFLVKVMYYISFELYGYWFLYIILKIRVKFKMNYNKKYCVILIW